MPGVLGARGEEAHVTAPRDLSSPPPQAGWAGLTAAVRGIRTSQMRKPGEGQHVMETWGSLCVCRSCKGCCFPVCTRYERGWWVPWGPSAFCKSQSILEGLLLTSCGQSHLEPDHALKEHVRKPQGIISLCGNNLQGAWIAVMVHCCLLQVCLCINSSICLLWLPWLLNTYTQDHFDIVKIQFLDLAP